MRIRRRHAASSSALGSRMSLSLLLALWIVLSFTATAVSADRGEAELEASILRDKPGVVLISSEVGAEVTIRCGTGPAQMVTPDPEYETGSGFIIHPDGYIATNGHVVAGFYEMNEQAYTDEFLGVAAAQACGPGLGTLTEAARKVRLRAIAADPANRGQVRLTKKLQVHLSTGKVYPAQVLIYSPAINPNASRAGEEAPGRDMGPMERSGKDIAILKIVESNLPTVRLAANSASLQFGEQIFIIGYPGVVLWHDFLSKKSALEASVTVGRVSGFKIDITDRRVIQTDASISWGNSGGPAFNRRGEVIGAATFISTTAEGDQAIQGFNFLIPVETVHEFARTVSLTPTADSPFTRTWERAVASYFQGDYPGAAKSVNEAEQIMPGFPDLRRLAAEVRMREKNSMGFGGGLTPWVGLGVGVGGLLLAMGARKFLGSRIQQARESVPRISPNEIRTRLDAGAPVSLVDARRSASFAESPVQAVGAVRYDLERSSPQALRLQVAPSGEVVAYCDCPDEWTSAQVALQLLRGGYRQVAVVRGGFQGLVEAGVAMAPKDGAATPSPETSVGSGAPDARSDA